MELSDGIDFYEWVATVRSLSAAVDRLERTVRLLDDWQRRAGEMVGPMTLDRDPGHREAQAAARERPEVNAPAATAAPGSPTSAGGPNGSRPGPMLPDDEEQAPDETGGPELMTEYAEDPVGREGPGSGALDERLPPPRFGDPEAIRLYGRRRRG